MSAAVDEPLTVTLAEAAAMIGVSRSTVDRLIAEGHIYERKVPGIRRRLISRASVVAFVDDPPNVARLRGGAGAGRPGQLVSLPAAAGGELVDLEETTGPGRTPGRQ